MFSLVLMLAAQAAPFDVADIEPLMRKHCETEWPSDYAMQENCLREQMKSGQRFTRLSKSVNRDLHPQLDTCIRDWTKAGVPDWTMISHCAEQQVDAFNRIQK